jgi:pilus assembly protein Flp/PilA
MARVMTLRSEKEEGQTLVEYALIIALMSIALVGVLELLAGGVDEVFQTIIDELEGAT